MNRILILLLLVLIQSCAVKVRTIYDLNYNFDQLSRFCWKERCEMTFKGPGYVNDSLLVNSVSELITEELINKGFTKDSYDHNFLVDVHIVLKEKQAVHHTSDDHGFEEGEWITADNKNISPEDEIYNYIEGTFVVDIVDFANGTLVWRSAVIGAFEQKPEFEVKHLRRVVKSALENFPPDTN